MRSVVLWGIVFLAGCASGSGVGGSLDNPTIQRVGATTIAPGGQLTRYQSFAYFDDPVVVREAVEAPWAQVWSVLPLAFRQESLEPDLIDPETRTVGVSRTEWVRRLGEQRLSTYLDCGSTTTGSPLAVQARVQASIVSRLTPVDSASTEIALRLEAVAFPFEAAAGRVQSCTSTGVLEHNIIFRVKDRLGRGVGPGTAVSASSP